MTSLKGRLREMKCQVGTLQRADGSCSFSQGKTYLWASCSGPGDVHISRRNNDCLSLDVSFRKQDGDATHHKLNDLIHSTLKHLVITNLFPRTCLLVTIHSLQDDGSLSAAALTAAGFAVLDNAVPIRAPFCGVEVCRVNGELIVDPDKRTEQKADATFVFAMARTEDGEAQQVCSDSSGIFDVEEYEQALSFAKSAAKEIFAFQKEIFQHKFTLDTFNTASSGET
ncbi:hypothetical protein WR25_19661 [Diploscapter pachys]|uniref:Uncharacterized protein n=1 Tax=Diploscapter pachys TaxID=2018661 RepID=A0A2A2LTN8_9BILA|nr:hypothetical protein WR25_19661 [Diploscapter pachys]